MTHINPILAAAAADMLVGMFWYSDYAFGPLWQKVSGYKTEMKKDLYLRIAVQVVSSLMIATAFYIAILTFQKTQVSFAQDAYTKLYSWFFKEDTSENANLMSALKIAGFIWFGFFVPSNLSCTVWRPTINWQKMLLKVGSKLAQFLSMAAALAIFG